MKKIVKVLFLFYLSVVVLCTTSCVSNTHYYGFGFDLRYDDQHTEILDYWYGNSSRDWWIRPPFEAVQEGEKFYFQNVFQKMSRGILYVKWRDTKSGDVHEETIDFRDRLPGNMENKEVYLMFKNSNPFVYLIFDNELRLPDETTDGPKNFSSKKVVLIYPVQSKQ